MTTTFGKKKKKKKLIFHKTDGVGIKHTKKKKKKKMLRNTHIAMEKVLVGSAMIGGLPTLTQLSRGMAAKKFHQKKEGMVSVSNPASSKPPRKGRVFKAANLNKSQEEFVTQARQDLRDSGISDNMRYNAWMEDDHSIFPERVGELNPQVKQLVKFGGLGLTQQSEINKVIKREKRMSDSEKVATSKQPLLDPKLLQLAQEADSKTNKAIRSGVNNLKSKHDELRESFSASGAFDRDTDKAKQESDAEVWLAKYQTRGEFQKREKAREQRTNAILRNTNRPTVSFHSARDTGVDLSESMAVVARCILTDVPCNGNWPISIPASRRLRFEGILQEHMNEVLEGLSGVRRGHVLSMVRRNEGHQLTKDSWKSWKNADEAGGIGNARDWKQQHPWEDVQKNNEEDAFKPLTRDSAYGQWSPEFQNTKYKQGLNVLMNTKSTADKPLSDYHQQHGNYSLERNSTRLAGGRYQELFVGRHAHRYGMMPARVRAAAGAQNTGY